MKPALAGSLARSTKQWAVAAGSEADTAEGLTWRLEGSAIAIVKGDITTLPVDAIVNAANAALAGGGGVDGAIHRAGGPAIMEETRRRYPDGCPTGQAVITGAGALPARWVIHAVAPRWAGGGRGEPDLLRSAYEQALARAAEAGATSVALPSLGTGIYGNPLAPSARIALEAAARHLRRGVEPRRVVFALFNDETVAAFAAALADLQREQVDAGA